MRVLLSTRTKAHVTEFWGKTQDPEIKRLIPLRSDTVEDALSLFEASQKEGSFSFGKVIYHHNAYVGDIWCYGIDEQNEKLAMLSIVIFDKTLWRQGIATEAIKAFVQEVFSIYKIDKMGAFTYSHNDSSIGMLKKTGFQELERFVEDGIESQYFELPREDFIASLHVQG